jgi:zinc transport system substrate-binding protein
MKSELAQLAGTPVVAQHDSFPYLARDLGLEVVGVIEEGHGHEPDAAEFARTIDLVRDKKVKFIFAEPQYSVRLAQTLARESGATVLQLDPVAQGPSEPSRARGAWLEAMEKNLSVLRGALR